MALLGRAAGIRYSYAYNTLSYSEGKRNVALSIFGHVPRTEVAERTVSRIEESKFDDGSVRNELLRGAKATRRETRK